jgi:integrase
MALYKRGGVYWYSFIWRGSRVQKSTKQGNQKIARELEAAHRTALAKGEAGMFERKAAPTLKEFGQRFIDNASVGRRRAPRASTLEFYAGRMNCLLAFEPLASARLDNINPELVERYVKSRQSKVGPACLNRDLATLRRCLHVALELGLIQAVPKITLLQGERERDFVLSPEQERLYLETAPQPLKDMAVLMLESGLRVGEACGLEWRDVRLEPVNGARFGFIHVRDGKSRNARRTIPLTERAGTMLAERSKGAKGQWVFDSEDHRGPLSRSTVSHQHTILRRLLKMPDGFVVHSLRHTMLTRLGASGADAFSIKRIAGHSSVTVSEKYIHPTPESLELAFQRFEALGSKAVAALPKAPESVGVATVSTTVGIEQEADKLQVI